MRSLLLRVGRNIGWLRRPVLRLMRIRRWYLRRHPWLQAMFLNSLITLAFALLVFAPAALLVGARQALNITKLAVLGFAAMFGLMRFWTWERGRLWVMSGLRPLWMKSKIVAANYKSLTIWLLGVGYFLYLNLPTAPPSRKAIYIWLYAIVGLLLNLYLRNRRRNKQFAHEAEKFEERTGEICEKIDRVVKTKGHAAEQEILNELRDVSRLNNKTRLYYMSLPENYLLTGLWISGWALLSWWLLPVAAWLGLVIALVVTLRYSRVEVPIAHNGVVLVFKKRVPIVVREGLYFLLVPRKWFSVKIVPVKEFSLEIKALTVLSKDSVRTEIPVILQYRVFNPYDVIDLDKPEGALQWFFEPIVRAFVADHKADECKRNRSIILGELAKNVISTNTEDGWGIHILSIFVGDVSFSTEVEEAMQRERIEKAQVKAESIEVHKLRDWVQLVKARGLDLTDEQILNAIQAERGKADKTVFNLEGLGPALEALGRALRGEDKGGD